MSSSSDIDPTDTVVGVFSDLGKRVMIFMVLIFSGIIYGTIVGSLNHLIFRNRRGVESATEDDPLAIDRIYSLPDMNIVFLGLLAAAAVVVGSIMIVRGGTRFFHFASVLFGGCLLAQLMGLKFGWQMGILVWILIGLLLVGSFFLFRKWRMKEEEAWQSELDAIYEENRLKREAKAREEAERLAEADEDAWTEGQSAGEEGPEHERAEGESPEVSEEKEEEVTLKIASALAASKGDLTPEILREVKRQEAADKAPPQGATENEEEQG